MIDTSKITSRNLPKIRKRLITAAKKIARTRDGKCRFNCSHNYTKLDGAHIIPVSRGWQYAVDTSNIIALCPTCHTLGRPSWHSDETWGWNQLEIHCPEVWRYCFVLRYEIRPFRVADAKLKAEELNEVARMMGIDI